MAQYHTLGDLMADYENELRAQAQKEMAAEKAAWDALTPEQQAAELDRKAKYAELFDVEDNPEEEDEECQLCGEVGCNEECDEEH